MNLRKVTAKAKRWKHEDLVEDASIGVYAWSALTATVEVPSEDKSFVYHIELSEEELRKMLGKIEARKAEIEAFMKVKRGDHGNAN